MTDTQHGNDTPHSARLVLAIGVFDSETKAQRVIEKLIKEDFPADRLSLLRKSGGAGDDMLGLAYTDSSERIKAWGEHGAAWGALWGLLAGATGLFVIPGIGPLLAAGPIVEALGGAIAGAAVAGGAMAGAAVLTEFASALHRMGIPETRIEDIRAAIEGGKYVVILHCQPDEAERCARRLDWAGADPVIKLPVEH